jgi:pyrroline-5-carboxylate reductase
MAAAMARGWAGADGGPEAMSFCDLDRERARSLAREVGGEAVDSLPDLAREVDLVVLTVKPAALDSVAAELGGRAPALLSVLAATPLARIGEAFPGVPTIRVMPNQPVEVRRGVLCYVRPEEFPGPLGDRLIALLDLLGDAVPMEESRIDAAMAVMSCSPAYVAMIAEALAGAGEREGLDPDLARELVAGAFSGTAELIRVKEPAAIRRAVAPPGGATEAGLQALERRQVPTAFAEAVDASLERFR